MSHDRFVSFVPSCDVTQKALKAGSLDLGLPDGAIVTIDGRGVTVDGKPVELTDEQRRKMQAFLNVVNSF